MTQDWNEETQKKAAKLGLTATALRALVKPLFLLLYDHGRTSITIRREGTHCHVEIT